MLQILAYCFFNILGFIIFYVIWLWMPKPEAYDYTTIPGLKCETLPPTKASIALPFGTRLDDIASEAGNLDQICQFDDAVAFFRWLHNFYGQLAAFWWGRRYTVSIGSVEAALELKRYAHARKRVDSRLYASVLNGDTEAWLTKEDTNLFDTSTTQVIAAEQSNLFFNNTSSSTNKDIAIVDGPLVFIYEQEIELLAHPVPANVPILISAHCVSDLSKADKEIMLQELLKLVNSE